MTHPWQPDLKRALACQFFYEVPEPACGCRFEDGEPYEDPPTCDLCENWNSTVECHKLAHVRVQLDDGRYVDCCDEMAHGYARVLWWAPLWSQPVPGGGPGCLAPVSVLMKYFYSEQSIGELATREHPFFSMIAKVNPTSPWKGQDEGAATKVSYAVAFTAAGVEQAAGPCDPADPCTIQRGACAVHGGGDR